MPAMAGPPEDDDFVSFHQARMRQRGTLLPVLRKSIFDEDCHDAKVVATKADTGIINDVQTPKKTDLFDDGTDILKDGPFILTPPKPAPLRPFQNQG